MEARLRVYLSDLGHNKLTFSSDIYPIGAANLAAYATAYLKSSKPVEFRLFREPQDLHAALNSAAPDVLALSSYAWNHELSRSFARYAKNLNQGTITMMGGPNYPLTIEEMASHLESMPEVDIAVRGPTYEGERAFLGVMQRLIDVGGSLAGLMEEPTTGSIARRARSSADRSFRASMTSMRSRRRT